MSRTARKLDDLQRISKEQYGGGKEIKSASMQWKGLERCGTVKEKWSDELTSYGMAKTCIVNIIYIRTKKRRNYYENFED